MAEQSGADKTEAPTPRRLADARERGQVPISKDLSGAALLLVGFIVIWFVADEIFGRMLALMRRMFEAEFIADLDPGMLTPVLLETAAWVARTLAPMLAALAVVAVLSNVFQIGLLLSPKKLEPQLASLNPFKGIKRIFGGGQGPMSIVFNLLKIVLVTGVAYTALHGKLASIVNVAQLGPALALTYGASLVFDVAIRIALVLFILALFDYAWQKFKFTRDLRMTKQEVKDEMKRMEGDPHIKQRRRQIQMQRAMQRVNREVPTADVVVTNPTHFAVALRYDPAKGNAPRVVAKGMDYLALRIRQIATENGVPIVEKPVLARALHRAVEVGHEVPEQFYAAVAEILAYVWELSGKTAHKRRQTTEALSTR
jgi:flagellar biosynthetic protein FlhB